jgi:predicted  nucleic acid-binding Zn-ribbon protein
MEQMVEQIERLLILQDRDRKVIRTRQELSGIEPQRRTLHSRLAGAQSHQESLKLRVKQLESERKRLELEVEVKKQQIERYSLQQFQTKKNEEYRALAHEIQTCKAEIVKLEDQELELMEQAEQSSREMKLATQRANEMRRDIEAQIAELGRREQNLIQQLGELEADRGNLVAAVEPSVVGRYERLLKHKGDNVVVGIDHGVCGGCHMKLPVQIVVSCQGRQELITCPNCGRILYYSREMDLAVAE